MTSEEDRGVYQLKLYMNKKKKLSIAEWLRDIFIIIKSRWHHGISLSLSHPHALNTRPYCLALQDVL